MAGALAAYGGRAFVACEQKVRLDGVHFQLVGDAFVACGSALLMRLGLAVGAS
jgi:hypothetical protein